MVKISVIVPIYNVKPFLFRCINSILRQTYKNIEIILVDDGSTDGSGELCEIISKNLENIIVIHKSNGGLSSARNEGISYASGEFLCFIDSDDVISEDYVSYLYSLYEKYNCDVAMGEFETFFDNITFNNPYGNNVRVFTGRQALRELLSTNYVSATIACNKLYKKEVFAELRFPEGLINEDEAVAYLILSNATKVVFSNAIIYGYYQREHSITKSNFGMRNFDYLKIAKERAKYFKRINDIEFYHLFDKQYCWALLTFADKARNILHDRAKEKELITEFRNESRVLFNSKYISFVCRGALVFLRVFPYSFNLLCKFNKNINAAKHLSDS